MKGQAFVAKLEDAREDGESPTSTDLIHIGDVEIPGEHRMALLDIGITKAKVPERQITRLGKDVEIDSVVHVAVHVEPARPNDASVGEHSPLPPSQLDRSTRCG